MLVLLMYIMGIHSCWYILQFGMHQGSSMRRMVRHNKDKDKFRPWPFTGLSQFRLSDFAAACRDLPKMFASACLYVAIPS